MIVWLLLICSVSCLEYAVKQDGTVQSWAGLARDNEMGMLGNGMNTAAGTQIVQSFFPILANFPHRIRSICSARQYGPPTRIFITDDGQLFA
jgi:hypothetical protein